MTLTALGLGKFKLTKPARRSGSTGDGGRRDALQDLNKDRVSLAAAPLEKAWLPAVDLTGADLTGANLQGADLTGANLKDALLWGADLQGATLAFANLKSAVLGTSISGRSLAPSTHLLRWSAERETFVAYKTQGGAAGGANLQDADLQDANLQDATLENADLRGVRAVAPVRKNACRVACKRASKKAYEQPRRRACLQSRF